MIEQKIVKQITKMLPKRNKDNISRTVFYQNFYFQYKEMYWAFLASFVSRNAGWNMTDLETDVYRKLLPPEMRQRFVMTYEWANRLIFADAYPQLLIYHYSKRWNEPLFGLLDKFNVSHFMKNEWWHFWKTSDKWRLCMAQIINEQHIIERPIIKHPLLKKRVFSSLSFHFQESLHFSTVLFPTLSGQLYGFSVSRFQSVSERIKLGKKLQWLLFRSGHLLAFERFAKRTTPTGSRNDYNRYGFQGLKTPMLRTVYPVFTYERSTTIPWDWHLRPCSLETYFKKEATITKNYELTNWYRKKEKQLATLAQIYDRISAAFDK